MSSIPATIAEAVKVALNAGSFSANFTAERAYMPRKELSTLTRLAVLVVPKAIEQTRLDRRNSVREEVQIDVAVMQKVASDNVSAVDALADLVQEIADYLRETEIDAGDIDAGWMRCENSPIYSPDMLDGSGAFVSVLTITYHAVR